MMEPLVVKEITHKSLPLIFEGKHKNVFRKIFVQVFKSSSLKNMLGGVHFILKCLTSYVWAGEVSLKYFARWERST